MNKSREISVLTFDCYGTLIDWETGIREVFDRLAARHDPSCDVDRLLARWEAIQFEQIAGPYRRYRDILQDSLRATWAEQDIALDDEESAWLGARLGTWQPFDDTCRSLARLKQDYRLAILSNIDDDLLSQSVARLGVEFDALITAEQVRSYKPRPAHFDEALRRFALPAERFLHVAFGFKYDQRPALERGMLTAWIKRPGWIRDDDAEPTYQSDSLDELTEFLTAR